MTSRVRAIISFIEKLTVPSGKGAGKPFKLMLFQKKFIDAVYGPIDKDGKRIVRRAILSMARKNGKSMISACLALVHLWGPEKTMNSEIYVCANDREQAGILFRYCSQIVRADPELMAAIKIINSTKTMLAFDTGSVFRAVSAEVGTKFGLNPVLCIYDELSQARNRELYDAFDTSFGARSEPLFIIISTQSNDPQHPLSILIDDGLSGHDPSTVCHLKCVPDNAENVFTDKKLWKLANPALGYFRSLSDMKTVAKRAIRMPTFEASFRNLYLNQRCQAESPLIPRAEWVACQGDATIEPGSEIYLGLDLSKKIDLTALVAVTAGENERVKAWFWKPQSSLISDENRDRVPYTVWKKQGFIEAVPGTSIDYAWVAARIERISHEYKILGIAYDRKYMDDLLNAMAKQDIESYSDKTDKNISHGDEAIRLVDWGQGFYGMPPAIEALEISVLNRKLIHDGNPVLTWNISNALTIPDEAGNRKFNKKKARFRIDGAVALAMAVGLKSSDIKGIRGPSIYETSPIKVFG